MIFVKNGRDRITTVPGVGNLWIPGYLEPNIRVWVKKDELKKYAMSVNDVVMNIQNEHREPPSGRTEFDNKEYSLRTLGESKKNY